MNEYKLTITRDKNGMIRCDSSCDGFNAFELLGLLYQKTCDLQDQIKGYTKPDFITRKYIEQEPADE